MQQPSQGATSGDGMTPASPVNIVKEYDDAGTKVVDLVWRCTHCGYQRLAAAKPDGCSACGASAEHIIGRTSIEWRFLMRHDVEH
jgi:ABC-type ATPase with predicted acetyltransferase domain